MQLKLNVIADNFSSETIQGALYERERERERERVVGGGEGREGGSL